MLESYAGEGPYPKWDDIRHAYDVSERSKDRTRYFRSSTGTLHLRAKDPGEYDGLSDQYSRCGLEFDLMRESIPLIVGEEETYCKKCPRIEP